MSSPSYPPCVSVLTCPHPCRLYQATIQTFATQLREDLSTTPTSGNSISLAAKWLPAEGKSYDKYLNMYEEIACAMSGVEKKDCTAGQLEGLKANLRKDVLRPLKERLRLVESKMSQGKWDKIGEPLAREMI